MKTDPQSEYNISISKAELAALPAARYVGNIHVINKSEEVIPALECLQRAEIVGFDTETRPSFKKGQTHIVSLMQLATYSDCFLFRLNKIGMPRELLKYLEDDAYTKIGLSLHDDFHNLQRLAPELKPKGFIDLQDYVKRWRITDISLTKINAILFDHRISKSQRLTNWEADTLTAHQQSYAALDALACIKIYDYLRSGKFDPSQSRYIHTDLPDEPAAN